MSEILIKNVDKEQRYFDVLASVDMIRFDLQNSDVIHPETHKRVLDEELTYIAEGINRAMYTRFVLRQEDNDLSYFSKGKWRPYIGTLATGLETAINEAQKDIRKTFQVERAANDLNIGLKFESLKPGEKLNWYSSYPEREEELYGEEFIQNEGYNPKRKMGFLYQATRNQDSSLTLDSQTVDNSNQDAFEMAILLASYDQSKTIHDMREEYDKVLSVQKGGNYYAGRKATEMNRQVDAWVEIQKHNDLIAYFMNGIVSLALDTTLTRGELENRKKELTYGVWAALKERLDYGAIFTHNSNSPVMLGREVQRAFTRLSMRKEVLTGCGGSIKGRESILDSEPGDVFDSVFGDEKSSESWTWKKGICRVDNCPTKPGMTEVGPCDVCRNCQHWFDKGRDPGKLFKGLRLAAKNLLI